MKILAIIGSPRKSGNTYAFVSKIEKHLKDRGGVEFSYLFLADANLGICRGCAVCLSEGEDKCPLKDDRQEIERRILDADGVIIASPVYAMNMTALTKNFMDRFAFTMHRPRFFKQYMLVACITGAVGLPETIRSISFLRYCGFNVAGSVGVVMNGLTIKSRRVTEAIEKRAFATAQKFYNTLIKRPRPCAGFMDIARFRLQQTMFQELKDENPGDHHYFRQKGWFDPARRYYVDAAINPVIELAAKAVVTVVVRQVRKALKESEAK